MSQARKAVEEVFYESRGAAVALNAATLIDLGHTAPCRRHKGISGIVVFPTSVVLFTPDLAKRSCRSPTHL